MSELTKQAMAASLKKLLSQKTLDKITIREITDDCGIRRQTFYYHFQDVYDLMEWLFLQEAERVIGQEDICKVWHDIYLEVFRYIEQNRSFVINAYHSVSREALERFLYKLTFDLIKKVVDGMENSQKMSEEEKLFICGFYKFGIVGIVLEWIGQGMKEDPEIISERLNRLLEKHMAGDF